MLTIPIEVTVALYTHCCADTHVSREGSPKILSCYNYWQGCASRLCMDDLPLELGLHTSGCST